MCKSKLTNSQKHSKTFNNFQKHSKNIQKIVCENGYENSDNVMRRGVLLPVHHGMTEEMFEKFFYVIELFLEQYK